MKRTDVQKVKIVSHWMPEINIFLSDLTKIRKEKVCEQLLHINSPNDCQGIMNKIKELEKLMELHLVLNQAILEKDISFVE